MMTDSELIDRLSALRVEFDAILAALYARGRTSTNNGLMQDVCRGCKRCAIAKAAGEIDTEGGQGNG